MIKEFEHKGEWWLPDDPQKRIKGTLKFNSGEGALLDLIGSFKDFKSFVGTMKADIILGETTNGKAVTLYRCFEKSSSMSFPGGITSVIFANYVFVGAHFLKTETILFKDVSVYYLHLDEWVNKYNCMVDIPKDEEGRIVNIKYVLPQPIPVANDNQYKISINFNANFPSPTVKEISIRQKAEIKIETTVEMSFEYYMTLLYRIQNFLCLGMMEPTYPISIKGTAEASKIELNGKTYYNTVEIFFLLPESLEINKKISIHDMLFIFNDIADNIALYFGNWLQKSELLEPAFDLYFGTLYNRRMYLQQRFLSLSQAVESYHRRTLQGKYQSDEDYLRGLYPEFVKCIPTGLEEGFKESLQRRMKYLNEFSLRKRLTELFKKHEDVLFRKIGTTNKLIDDVVNTRNFLTHYDIDLDLKAKSGEELYILCEKLKFILEVSFLFEIALPPQKIKDLVSRNSSYRHIA